MKLLDVTDDPAKQDVILRVRENDGEKVLPIYRKCNVTVNGLDARWADLKPGDILTVRPGHVIADRCTREE